MTMPTDRPRYYCPRYPTSHYDDSPDGYGPCAWCGTDSAHIAPPVECPSCGARYGAALRAMRRAESDYEDAALERTWLSFLLVTSVAIIVGGVAWFVVSLVTGEDVLSPILVASGGLVGYLKGQLAWLKLPTSNARDR